MAADKSHYTHMEIRCGGLIVQIGTETEYPDLVDDLANRISAVYKEAMAHAKENGIDVSDMRLITSDYGDEDEEEYWRKIPIMKWTGLIKTNLESNG